MQPGYKQQMFSGSGAPTKQLGTGGGKTAAQKLLTREQQMGQALKGQGIYDQLVHTVDPTVQHKQTPAFGLAGKEASEVSELDKTKGTNFELEPSVIVEPAVNS